MRNLLLSLFCCCSTLASSQIDFQPFDVAALKQKAQKEQKLILLVFVAPWSSPCQTMRREVFLNTEVSDYYNSRFLCTQIDSDKNKNFAASFEVEIFPDFVVLNPKGERIYHFGGYLAAADFKAKGERAWKIFESGKKESLYDRLEWCANMEKWQDCNETLADFGRGEDWKTTEGVAMLMDFARHQNRVAIEHYSRNRSAYEQLTDSSQMRQFKANLAMAVLLPVFQQAQVAQTTPHWASVQDSIRYYTGKDDPWLLGQAKVYFYREVGDWANYFLTDDALIQSLLIGKSKEAQIRIYRETIDRWMLLVQEEQDEEEDANQTPLRIGLEYIYKYLLALEELSRSAEVYEMLIGVTEAMGKEKEADYYYDLWQRVKR